MIKASPFPFYFFNWLSSKRDLLLCLEGFGWHLYSFCKAGPEGLPLKGVLGDSLSFSRVPFNAIEGLVNGGQGWCLSVQREERHWDSLLYFINYITRSGQPLRMACETVDEAIGSAASSQVPCHLYESPPVKFQQPSDRLLGASPTFFLLNWLV